MSKRYATVELNGFLELRLFSLSTRETVRCQLTPKTAKLLADALNLYAAPSVKSVADPYDGRFVLPSIDLTPIPETPTRPVIRLGKSGRGAVRLKK